MNSAVDEFVAETEDQVEWRLSGWAFLPGEQLHRAAAEIEDERVGPVSYGWERKDVLTTFPSTCPSERVGFKAQILLPAGLKPGSHNLHVVFFGETGHEEGRIAVPFVTDREINTSVSDLAHPEIDEAHPHAAYLDLLEKSLLGLPYAGEQELRQREEGLDWPTIAHTMIGRKRLQHLRACAETALRDNIPGDFMETGVWRGGACIMLRGILKACDVTTRNVWVADSFRGLPKPNHLKYPADAGADFHTFAELAVPLDSVQENFRKYSLLDGQVKFLVGLFSETLPNSPVEQLSVLRLDGDMYESTMDALTWLYPRLSPGGFCIADDYGAIPACRQAVRDYRRIHGISDAIQMIDWTGAWWRKSGSATSPPHDVINAGISGAKKIDALLATTKAPPAIRRDAIIPNAIPLGSLLLTHPSRLSASTWIEHIPFAFWLVEHLKPATIVELGVHTGCSYCAFCQAVAALQLKTRCYGVDTFLGDPHAGFYGSDILEDLRAHHDPLYGSFSELIQSTFDDALNRFEDGSIDLLHVDGLHYYENVAHDFASWRPKLSPRAIVLFHDTQVTDRGFGVSQFWREVSQVFPTFEFRHGHGLGVLDAGPEIKPAIKSLFATTKEEQATVRRLFSTLGNRLTLLARESEVSRLQSELEANRNHVTSLGNRLNSLAEQQVLVQQAFMEVAHQGRKSGKSDF